MPAPGHRLQQDGGVQPPWGLAGRGGWTVGLFNSVSNGTRPTLAQVALFNRDMIFGKLGNN